MCEERIESAYDIKGIVMADYDLKTKMLHVVYKTKFFNTPFLTFIKLQQTLATIRIR